VVIIKEKEDKLYITLSNITFIIKYKFFLIVFVLFYKTHFTFITVLITYYQYTPNYVIFFLQFIINIMMKK
jgi:hypothetical protein